MLGKLVKNEFVHRSKAIITIFIGVIVLSIIQGILYLCESKELIAGQFFDMFFGIFTFIWVVGLMSSFVGVLIVSIGDYGNRFFKDQGYLTHTLPVKTSKLILARIIFDLAMILMMVLAYPLAISIAVRDFSMYDDLIDGVYKFVEVSCGGVEKALVVADVLGIIIAIFLGALFEIWHFNAAYALGHMFNKSKRALSVVFYIVIYIIVQTLVFWVLQIADTPVIAKMIRNVADGIDTEPGALLLVLTVMNIGMVIGVAVLAVITNVVCKRRLNLE